MSNLSGIREHMEVIGADGVHVGIVDRVEGGRIKLTRAEAPGGSHEGHHECRAVRGRRGRQDPPLTRRLRYRCHGWTRSLRQIAD
jgi:hypothetical protein